MISLRIENVQLLSKRHQIHIRQSLAFGAEPVKQAFPLGDKFNNRASNVHKLRASVPC